MSNTITSTHRESDTERVEPMEPTTSMGSAISSNQIFLDGCDDAEFDLPDITHHNVKYNRNYQRCKGTLGQIIKSIEDMKARSSSPTNEYQNKLYPQICDLCDQIVFRYLELLGTILHDDYVIFSRYLNGAYRDGTMRSTKIRHETKIYKYSQMKETLKSVKDRLDRIKKSARNCSKDETRDKNNRESFVRVIDFCDQYSADVDGYIAQWESIVKNCRLTNSDNKQNADRNESMADVGKYGYASGSNSNLKRLII